jgi:hypothetical protein
MAQVAALKPKDMQPAELLSTASYKSGEDAGDMTL